MKSMSMYSTQYLVGAPFACSNAAWHGVDQSVALLRCYESPGCSDSGISEIPIQLFDEILII